MAGRVLRAHGVRGEVLVEVRTDSPDRRFASGALLTTSSAGLALTVVASRRHHDRLLVRFEGVVDRDGAEGLRGAELLVDVSEELAAAPWTPPGGDPTTGRDAQTEPEAWFIDQLVGCRVEDTAGIEIGRVVGVRPGPAQDLLVVAHGGGEVLIPFVAELVPEVDVPGRRMVVAPPEGLLDL